MEKLAISKAALSRLPRYLEALRTLPDDGEYISAPALAKMLRLGEVQVRKDLAAVCGGGKPRCGYKREALIKKLEERLGCEKLTPAVLVGAGRLGRALLQYDEFERYGVKITAAFDINPDPKNGILPISSFEGYCAEHSVKLGIITVGEGSAQTVCDLMTENGIIAIWNFAPCILKAPDGVILQNENLALSLAHLNNQLRSII